MWDRKKIEKDLKKMRKERGIIYPDELKYEIIVHLLLDIREQLDYLCKCQPCFPFESIEKDTSGTADNFSKKGTVPTSEVEKKLKEE